MFVLFYRFDFPLKLRIVLWLALAAFLGAFRFVDLISLVLVLGIYLTFTIFLWGTVYYHLRIGTPWTNFTRFWRLVLENPDPTSGNFLEQIPKTLVLVLAFLMVVERPELTTIIALEGFIAGLGLAARPIAYANPPGRGGGSTEMQAIHSHRHRRVPRRPAAGGGYPVHRPRPARGDGLR